LPRAASVSAAFDNQILIELQLVQAVADIQSIGRIDDGITKSASDYRQAVVVDTGTKEHDQERALSEVSGEVRSKKN